MAEARRISIVVDERGVNRVTRELNKAQLAGDRLKRAFAGVTSALTKFGTWIWRHKLIISAAMAGIAYAIFKPFMSLELTLARVQVASGATAQGMIALGKVADQLGRDTLYSASQAAEGMLYLAKAGLSVEQQMAAIPGVLNAAIVEQMDLGTAADIVTGLLNEFKLTASDAALAADVLAKGSNLAKTDMQQMSEALKYFGASAHDLGYSIQESVAMLDVLAGSMIRGTMAGTGLRMSMIKFQQLAQGTVTKKGREVFQRLGLDFSDLLKQIRLGQVDFVELTGILREAGATTADMAALFETRAAPAMVALGDAARSSYKEYAEALMNAAGYSERAGAILENTLWGQTQQIKSSLQTMTNAIARTFAPALRDFLQYRMRPFINSLTEAWEAGDTLGEKFGNMLDTLAPAVESSMEAMLNAIKDWIPKIGAAMWELGVRMVSSLAKGLVQAMRVSLDEQLKNISRELGGFGLWGEYWNPPAPEKPKRSPLFSEDQLGIFSTFPKKAASKPSVLTFADFLARGAGVTGGLSLGGFAGEVGSVAGSIVAGQVGSLGQALSIASVEGAIAGANIIGGTIVSEDDLEAMLDEDIESLSDKIGKEILNYFLTPVMDALDTALGPTMRNIEDLTEAVLRIFDPLFSLLNAGLNLLKHFLGEGYTAGRYTAPGYYAIPGGGSVSSSVSIGQLSISGVRDGEQAGSRVVEEIAKYEEIGARSTARGLRRGMVSREAMER